MKVEVGGLDLLKDTEIMPSTMATTFIPAAKGSARTPLGPILKISNMLNVTLQFTTVEN